MCRASSSCHSPHRVTRHRQYYDPVDPTGQVYHNLGVKEVEDQLAVVKYLSETLLYVDTSRVAMWGWQYGAFVTLMALAKDPENLIKCGVAVAPITRWEHYSEWGRQSVQITVQYMKCQASGRRYLFVFCHCDQKFNLVSSFWLIQVKSTNS